MGERVKLFDPTTDGSMVAKHLKQLFCQIGLPSNTLTPGTVGSFCEVSKKKMQLLKLPSIEAETSIANANEMRLVAFTDTIGSSLRSGGESSTDGARGDKDGDTTGLVGDTAYIRASTSAANTAAVAAASSAAAPPRPADGVRLRNLGLPPRVRLRGERRRFRRRFHRRTVW